MRPQSSSLRAPCDDLLTSPAEVLEDAGGATFAPDGKVRPAPEALGRRFHPSHEKPPAQVALRWLLEQELVLPIAGAKNAAQASSNAAALTFALDAAEVEALEQATRAWRE
jgi:aryl-alcohol dehydrogenase-like predicted oxidoreductase